MKHYGFDLTKSDIQALLLGLGILPHLDFELDEAQQSINDALCNTCINKLHNQEQDFNANEIRIMSCAIDVMDEIIRDEWELDPELVSKCREFIFNVNKLLPKFESILPEH